ncbi:MAG: hypothetical protein KAY37_15840 [Phycisphaerae bacterium]|nr:hypothetical protein [Phycisphaerae bacterium]
MSTETFLQPRLIGERFEGHAIPLEFLKDLAVLEEMIVEVAKWRFLEEHPERKRSPRGFTEGIELKLTGVEDGSAIAVISLVVASSTLFPPDNQSYFEEARDAIVSVIDAAKQDKSITERFPEKALGYFDRMGRSLRSGEAIEFTTPSNSTPVRLTKEIRRKLVLASSAKELTEEISVRGAIPEADQDDMSFEIQLIDGRKVRAPMATQHLDTILEAFNGYKSGARVLIQGVGKFNRNERLQGLESIEHISILDPLDIPARLDELRSLQDGWLDGKGIAPSSEELDWLAKAFDARYPEDLPLPFVYPTAEGGIRAEWSVKPYEMSLEIDLSKKTGEWHQLKMDTDDEDTRSLNLETDEDWKWLADTIGKVQEGAA